MHDSLSLYEQFTVGSHSIKFGIESTVIHGSGKRPSTNLKAFSTKIALQHPNNRCTFSITYRVKYLINLASMIYLHLQKQFTKIKIDNIMIR